LEESSARQPGQDRDAAGVESDSGAGPSRAGDPNRLWRDLLALDARLFEQRKIRFLTPEARVMIHLKLSGSTPVTEAMQVAGTSYRGFYAVLERLREAGIVATVRDTEDQRVRRLSLDPSIPIAP